MWYALCFIAGVMFGVLIMCLCVVSGMQIKESKEEDMEKDYIEKMTRPELAMILKVLESELEKREEDIRGLRKLVESVRGALIDKGGRIP